MAVRVMVRKEKASAPNVEIVRNYPGHEEGLIRHGAACPLRGKHDVSGVHGPDCVRRSGTYGVDRDGNKRDYDDFCGEPFGPLYMETSYEGKVVATGERNMHDDSDFWCVVIEDDGSYRKFNYASTRGWSYPNGAWVDASPEDIAAYRAHEVKVYEALTRSRREAAEKAARERGEHVKRGDRIKVVKGRKVPCGIEAEVFWVGSCKFSGKSRLGIKDNAGETHWTAASNVEVVA